MRRLTLLRGAFVLIVLITLGLVLWRRSRPTRIPPGSIDLVIARYKEPLDWLVAYKDIPFRTVYIYTKSDTPVECPPLQGRCQIERLPNVGVCDHTYLHHIVKHYSDPADMTVFLPASAGAHPEKSRRVPLILANAQRGRPAISGVWTRLGQTVLDQEGSFYLNEWKVSDPTNRSANQDFTLVKATPRPFREWYARYFPNETSYVLSLAGQFAVTRSQIQARPLELYKALLATVDKDTFPEAAHYMERSWGTVFRGFRPGDVVGAVRMGLVFAG